MNEKKVWFFSVPKNKFRLNDLKLDNNSIIVPIDYESFTFLRSNRIPYNLPESYLEKQKYPQIDEISNKIASSWWKDPCVKDFSYEGINFGYLMEFEFQNTLVKLLKHVIEFEKIIQVEKPNIILGPLGQDMFTKIPEFVANRHKIKFVGYEIYSKNKPFLFDSVPIFFKIGSKLVTLNLSYKQINSISKTLQKISKIFQIIGRKNSENRLLLLDFNVDRHGNLLDGLEENGLHVVLLNKRRPVIWNLNSLKIELSKRYEFFNLTDYYNGESRTKVKKHVSLMYEKISELWTNQAIKKLFEIEEINLWDLIKDDFKEFLKNRIALAIEEIELGIQLLKKEKFSYLIEWGYSLPFEKTMLLLAKRFGLKSLEIQHGVYGIGKDKFGQRPTLFPCSKEADYLAVWGELTTKFFLDNNVDKDRVIEIGNPSYDNLFRLNKNYGSKRSGIILLATGGLGTSYSFHNTITVTKRYEDFIKQTCKVIKKLSNTKIIVKLHPYSDDKINIPKIVHEIDKNIQIAKNENIIDLIRNSDLVISTYSTVIIEAMIMGKLTLAFRLLSDAFESEHIPLQNSGASLTTDNPQEIPILIEKIFSDPKMREGLIRNSRKFLDRYLSNQGNSSKKLSEFIKKEMKIANE